MAIYHLSVQIIGRSGGKSVVASAAYRAGEKLQDEHVGQTFDYTKKRGVDYTEILAPSNAPEWASDRNRLWNEVENIEKSKNSQLARELNIAIPKELTRDQQIELIRNFAKEQFADKGMVADLALHNLAGENPHAHIMLTIRPFNEDETWGAKSKKEYIRDGNGEKIRLNSGEYKSRKIESTDWNKKETLEDWRKEWAEQTNQALEKAGVLDRVDHRSLKDQGERNRLPQKHIGVHANAMEKRDIKTERGDYNRAILEINADIKQYRNDNAVCKQAEKQYQTEVQAQTSTPPIIEPTRPTIVQQPSSKEDPWGEIITILEGDKTGTTQPGTFQVIKTELDQARTELRGQQEKIYEIEKKLRSETSKLRRYDDYERRINEGERRLGELSRFNPLNWSRIKILEQRKGIVIKDKQIDLGETEREDIEQRITQLNQEMQSGKKELPELTTRDDKANNAYDQRSTELRTMSRQKDLVKSQDLLERYKAGEKLTTPETRLVNSFSKELDIEKIPVKRRELELELER